MRLLRARGIEVARWLGDHGIAALVLRYRMPNGHHEIPLEDVHEAIRIARRNAPSWGVDPHQVGVMGFSAGGHLASTASTHFDERTRPDFSILIYPVITMGERYTHMGSRENLLGKGYDAGLVERYSSERQVTPQTPPAFIALSDNDEVVPSVTVSCITTRSKKTAYRPNCTSIRPAGTGWIGRFDYWDEYRAALLRWLGQVREGKLTE